MRKEVSPLPCRRREMGEKCAQKSEFLSLSRLRGEISHHAPPPAGVGRGNAAGGLRARGMRLRCAGRLLRVGGRRRRGSSASPVVSAGLDENRRVCVSQGLPASIGLRIFATFCTILAEPKLQGRGSGARSTVSTRSDENRRICVSRGVACGHRGRIAATFCTAIVSSELRG